MRQAVGIDGIRAQMLEHLAHHTFANRDIPGEADDVFVFPTAHNLTSDVIPVTDSERMILM
jgi:hypothetical protein